MSKLTNHENIPLSLAVWLGTDTYDYNPNPTVINVTSLIKPLKQLILSLRIKPEDILTDIMQSAQSKIGTAVHDSIERTWLHKEHRTNTLKALGYPSKIANNIVVNPTKEQLEADTSLIPVYLEIRSQKKVGKYTVSGKFDFISDGRIEDFKTTSTFTYEKSNKDNDYKLQGSIYRWLNQDIVTRDHMFINFIFLDWKPALAMSNPKYPKSRVLPYRIELMSLPETEAYINQRISDIERLKDAPENMLPACTSEDLWQAPPTYKYYKDPNKTKGRSTKNFTVESEAHIHLAKNQGKGVIITVPSEVKACKYCPAFSICEQKDDLIKSGLLKL